MIVHQSTESTDWVKIIRENEDSVQRHKEVVLLLIGRRPTTNMGSKLDIRSFIWGLGIQYQSESLKIKIVEELSNSLFVFVCLLN